MTKVYKFNDVILSASHIEEEEWRIFRLERVIGYVVALAEHYGNRELLDKIFELEDSKGMLTVYWKVEPTQGEKELFAEAWKSQIGDGCDTVEHLMLDFRKVYEASKNEHKP